MNLPHSFIRSVVDKFHAFMIFEFDYIFRWIQIIRIHQIKCERSEFVDKTHSTPAFLTCLATFLRFYQFISTLGWVRPLICETIKMGTYCFLTFLFFIFFWNGKFIRKIIYLVVFHYFFVVGERIWFYLIFYNKK